MPGRHGQRPQVLPDAADHIDASWCLGVLARFDN